MGVRSTNDQIGVTSAGLPAAAIPLDPPEWRRRSRKPVSGRFEVDFVG